LSTAYAQENTDTLVNVAFKTVAKKDLVVPAASVNVTEILKKSYSTNSLDNLGSFIGGYTGNIWGQAPLILVDGIPRRATDIRMTEVQSITVLKGASAVVLYGSSASKGVVMITTKRGSLQPLQIDVRANTGVYVPKSYPTYLNAADYKTLYNEALVNDKIATGSYPIDEINATRAGTNPYRYADVNLLGSEYLKKMYNKSDVTMEVSGGNDAARYYTNFGLAYNNDLLKYGEQKNNGNLQFNIRGNVDVKLSKKLSATMDAAAVSTNNYVGRGNFWNATSTLAPNFNRYSPFVPISMLDPSKPELQTIAQGSNHIIDGQYLLGGTSSSQTNVLADMLAAGYIKTKSNTFMYNLGLQADLSSVLRGLTFKATGSLDYTTLYTETYTLPYAIYEPKWETVNGKDIITDLKKWGVDRNSINEAVGSASYTQTVSLKAQFGYDRTFATDHNVTAALLGWGYTTQFSADNGGGYQPFKNTNLGVQAGYNYKRRYYLDFSGALVHSAKLPAGKRNGFSPTVTAAWRISDENFIKENLPFISDMKIKSSYSSIKQDLDITGFKAGNANPPVPTDHYLYQGYYGNTATLGGFYTWRDGLAGGRTTLVGQADNRGLTFVQRNELSVGLDASLFKNKVSVDLNYFSQTTDGLLARGATVYPSYFAGSGDFRPWLNYNKEQRKGFDFAVNWNEKIGEVQYSLGVTGMIYNTKVLRRDELPAESYQARTGLPIDASFGYISEGFFQSQADIANSARQTFGGAAVVPGDIKYQDVNKDGVIDAKDQVNLGRGGAGAAPFSYGVNLTVKWKRFTMFVLASGINGAVGYKNNSSYWVAGNTKYSDVVLGRWTEATKATATYPRLTTTNGVNNFQNSTFWMYNVSRFNLSRVQFTYNFDDKMFKKSFVHGLSVYVQGDDLLVISKDRKYMETNVGTPPVGTPPQTRFFNLGIKGSF
jgi:TonB-linked SusC/RagA family outer membrane protein